MSDVMVGQTIEVGWNGSKLLGDEYIAYSDMRIEAFGQGWVVLRDSLGRCYSYTNCNLKLGELIEDLES